MRNFIAAIFVFFSVDCYRELHDINSASKIALLISPVCFDSI